MSWSQYGPVTNICNFITLAQHGRPSDSPVLRMPSHAAEKTPVSRTLSISDIPPEILSEIFISCAATDPDAPIRLDAVCRAWRSTIARTPPMWAHLALTVTPDAESVALRKAACWLTMAGACTVTVDVAIRAPRLDASTEDKWLVPLADLLRVHLARIPTIAVRAEVEAQARIFLTALTTTPDMPEITPAPILSQISCHITTLASVALDSSSPVDTTWLAPALPALQTLSLTNTPLPISAPRLTHLTFIRPLRAPPLALAAITALLASMPSLAHLTLATRIAEPPGTPLPALALPALTHLTLRTNNLHDLLAPLAAPALTHLRLADLDGRAGVWTPRALRALLARTPQPRIRALALEGAALGGAGAPVWAWAFARLRWLAALRLVRCVGGGVGVFALLTARGTQSPAALAAALGEAAADVAVGGDVHVGADASAEDAACPRLRRLAFGLAGPAPGVLINAVRAFHGARPDVAVEVEIVGEVVIGPDAEFVFAEAAVDGEAERKRTV